MSTANIEVKDVDAYTLGFNKGTELILTHKKLVSVSASFIKSLISKEYSKSFHKGVADGWDYGFKKEKQKLQDQAKEKTFQERSKEREVEMQQMKKKPKGKENEQER